MAFPGYFSIDHFLLLQRQINISRWLTRKRITGESLLDWFVITLIPLPDRLVQFTYSFVDSFWNVKAKLKCLSSNLGSVYTGQDLLGTSGKLVRMNLAFTLDLVDPVRIGSAIWYQMGPLMKVIQ